MSKINTPDSETDFVENDEQCEAISRRHFERRKTVEELETSSHSTENDRGDELNLQDRRQCERRRSRPALLSIDEIAALRKK